MTTETAGGNGVTLNLIRRSFLECRLSRIELNLGEAASIELKQRDDSSSWVAIKFNGTMDEKTGITPYLIINDNRSRAVEIFEEEGVEAYKACFDVVTIPCLFAFRKRLGYYFALANIGTDDIHDGNEDGFILTKKPIDKRKYRIVVNEKNTGAIHEPTGICVIRPISYPAR